MYWDGGGNEEPLFNYENIQLLKPHIMETKVFYYVYRINEYILKEKRTIGYRWFPDTRER